MKYDFKDPKHREIVRLMGFSDEEIDETIKDYFDARATHHVGFFRDNMIFTIPAERFKPVREYKPDQWNPYPDVQPPKKGVYLVTVSSKDVYPLIVEFDSEGWNIFNDSVIAFRALPEPYQPEPPKDMHQDAIAARKYMGEEE